MGTPLGDRSVIGKVQLMLECFDVEEDHLPLSELMRRTGLAKGTVHRIAQDLVAWGLLERVGHSYRLGLRLFELGQAVPRQRIVREAAQPYMEDLFAATREVVHLGIVDGVDVLYLEKLIGHRTAESPSRTGGRMPLYCTAIGKALLAFSRSEVRERVMEHGLRPLTPYTIVVPAVLCAQLDRVRATGLAYEREESAHGLGCVAAPVFGPGGHLVAALSVAAPLPRYHPRRLIPAVRTTAAALSEALGAPHGSLAAPPQRPATVG